MDNGFVLNKTPRGKPSRLGSTFASLKRGILAELQSTSTASRGVLDPGYAVNKVIPSHITQVSLVPVKDSGILFQPISYQ
jgi:hypothetical protein